MASTFELSPPILLGVSLWQVVRGHLNDHNSACVGNGPSFASHSATGAAEVTRAPYAFAAGVVATGKILGATECTSRVVLSVPNS